MKSNTLVRWFRTRVDQSKINDLANNLHDERRLDDAENTCFWKSLTHFAGESFEEFYGPMIRSDFKDSSLRLNAKLRVKH